MKDIIALIEKSGENKELSIIENADKTVMVEVAKVSSAINLESKYNWAISNADMDAAEDLKLVDIKKY